MKNTRQDMLQFLSEISLNQMYCLTYLPMTSCYNKGCSRDPTKLSFANELFVVRNHNPFLEYHRFLEFSSSIRTNHPDFLRFSGPVVAAQNPRCFDENWGVVWCCALFLCARPGPELLVSLAQTSWINKQQQQQQQLCVKTEHSHY